MKEAFTRIFELYYNDIYYFIYSYTLDKTESKDILQEVFLKLYKNFEKLPDDDIQIKKWLMRVASNQSKDYIKSFWNTHTKSLSNEELNFNFSKNEEEIFNIIRKINKKYRKILYLYYYEGYDVCEIAHILNMGESAIKMRLSRAREKIKEEMER